ncbi:MAG TPA: hypothetical protein VHV51_25115 [Polyangiaceae bacterium]|jgi:hypothetical protein|nr:hypothetical protein [Polyangiaceae bacterium]
MGPIVLSVVLGVAAVQGVMWTLVNRRTRQRLSDQQNGLAAELAKDPNERLLRGPTRARIRRGHVDTHCTLALTDQRLLFFSRAHEQILLTEISTVGSNVWFRGEFRGGYEWLIITTQNGDEVGFISIDGDGGWPNAVREAMPQRNSVSLDSKADAK